MKKILLFSKDQDLYSSVAQNLEKNEYKVTVLGSLSDAADHIKQKLSDILLIDSDLQQVAPDELFKTFKSIAPRIKAIVLASTMDVSLAVNSIKAGVFDFLTKPVHFERLKESIENAFISQIPSRTPGQTSARDLWLSGSSAALSEFILKMEEAAVSEKDAVILSLPGVPRRRTGRLLHEKGINSAKRLARLDLSDYSKEGGESVFWPTIKELFLSKDESKGEVREHAGTVFLDNYDGIQPDFKQLLLEYLGARKEQNADRSVKAVLGAAGISPEDKEKVSKNFEIIYIPSVAERKEDIPALTDVYLKKYCAKYSKQIKGFSADVLNFFMDYEWPGNYKEMENLVESAVLLSGDRYIDMGDIESDLFMLLNVSVKKAVMSGKWELSMAKEIFEKKLIEALIAGSKGDLDRISSMLDMPKTGLVERIKRLGIRSEA